MQQGAAAKGGADPQTLPPPPPPPPQQQQQWAAMQYHHAAAMMVPPPQMVAAAFPPPQFAQHFVPYPHPPPHYPPAAAGGGGGGGEENKSIWVGDLHFWMDENYLHSCFGHTGEVLSIKVIRSKQTGQSEGYGFVEFYTRAAAEKVLQSFSGHIMPNTDQPFRLNWASFSMGDRRAEVASDHSIFVGDLASDVTDAVLQEIFATKYPSVKGAKVVIDANTGRSKGYGFVRFGDDNEKRLAMTEMNGIYCSSRPMRIGPATPRKSSGGSGSNGSGQSDGICWRLDPNVSEDDLRKTFSQYGDIASVKIPPGKQCGFVQFVQRNNAEEAMQSLNGTMIGKQTVRLSWGRNPASKQLRADFGNQWNGMYYGAQLYNGYGYAAQFPDPTVYAAPYGAYSYYGNQQQVS
uniref:RRM domain-containing protein n=1 Tax=Ananas comosus var. bracteatus TaxID=296719 RepID=A0A6V7P2S5_ANACO|nr:unnamed protein product [Ananas comosus var. bracteatus]